ncbi:MAG: hypothetical protein WC867_08620 [Candidatus Pacearchaeota archaeon]|jgi:hypothetical protein
MNKIKLSYFERSNYREMWFSRAMDFESALKFCYEVNKSLEDNCEVELNYDDEVLTMSEDMDRIQILYYPTEPRTEISGRFVRPEEKLSVLYKFILEPRTPTPGTRYNGIKVRAGFEEFPDINKDQYHNLSLFVEDVMFNIEEYAIKYFYMNEKKKR